MLCTRPDIAYVVGGFSRFMTNPGEAHLNTVKWILRYLKGTYRSFLHFKSGDPILQGYADADYAGDADSRKSTSRYMMTYVGGAVSWKSRLPKCVSLSTTYSEYISAVDACKEVLWMKNFLQELCIKQDKYTLFCDS
jgi:hypothetical protein